MSVQLVDELSRSEASTLPVDSLRAIFWVDVKHARLEIDLVLYMRPSLCFNSLHLQTLHLQTTSSPLVSSSAILIDAAKRERNIS